MKANNNKCVGPKGHALTAGTKLEVQDCNGGNDQAWITGETAAGSGIFMLKNVAAPGLCVDVAGASTANGTAMEIYPAPAPTTSCSARRCRRNGLADRRPSKGRSAHADRPFPFCAKPVVKTTFFLFFCR